MFPSSHSLSSSPLKTRFKSAFPHAINRRPAMRSRSVVMVDKRGADWWDLDSNPIDEDMIVLRKRIHEIRISDQSIPEPSDWMPWEKEYYMTAYPTDVYEVVGLLQRFLLSTRPSLAIGAVLLVLISVPTSLGFLLYRLLEVSSSVLSNITH